MLETWDLQNIKVQFILLMLALGLDPQRSLFSGYARLKK